MAEAASVNSKKTYGPGDSRWFKSMVDWLSSEDTTHDVNQSVASLILSPGFIQKRPPAYDEGDKLEEAVDMIYRLAGSFRGGRGRQFTSRGQFRGRSGPQQNTRRGCRHCDMFNKKIGANPDINHRSDSCPNQHSALLMIKAGLGSACSQWN